MLYRRIEKGTSHFDRQKHSRLELVGRYQLKSLTKVLRHGRRSALRLMMGVHTLVMELLRLLMRLCRGLGGLIVCLLGGLRSLVMCPLRRLHSLLMSLLLLPLLFHDKRV
jgi:hypothetical protein